MEDPSKDLPEAKGETLKNLGSQRGDVDGIFAEELRRGCLRWLKSGLAQVGLFEGAISLESLFIAWNSFTSPGSSWELLDHLL